MWIKSRPGATAVAHVNLKSWTVLTLTLSWGVSAQQASVESNLYQGNIGPAAIVFQLSGTTGKYFYLSRGLPLSLTLQGPSAGSSLRLEERLSGIGADPQPLTGTFTLRRVQDGWTGIWQDPAGRQRLPVKLQAVNLSQNSAALPFSKELGRLQKQDVFNYLRINHPWRTISPSAAFDGLPGVREPLSGVAYPRVPGHEALNAALQDQQLQDVLGALDCAAQVPISGTGRPAWDVHSQVTWQSAHLLTLQTVGTAFCGGAHPADIAQTQTFDLQTGARVNVRALWPGLTDMALRRLYLAAYPKSNPDCAQAVQDSLDTTSYPAHPEVFPMKTGLALWLPDLPHVTFACNLPLKVNYADIRSQADTNNPYFAEFYRK